MTGRAAKVLGLGQVSAVGAGTDALRGALAGRTPAPEPSWADCFEGAADGRLPRLLAVTGEAEGLVPSRVGRRLDRFSLCALVAAELAMGELDRPPADPTRVGIALATGWGAMQSTFRYLGDIFAKGDGLASPLLFPRTMHSAPAAVMSSTLGVRGPVSSFTGFGRAWSHALGGALGWLQAGAASEVLLVSADEHYDGVAWGRMQLGGWAPDGRMRPLDLERGSHVPGETYTAMVLVRADDERPARWGTIEEPRFGGAGEETTGGAPAPLFLAAHGDPDEAPRYLEIARAAHEIAAYGALWGGNPTVEAMSAVAAAISLADGRIYDVPARDSATGGLAVVSPGRPAGGLAAIRCASVDGRGRRAFVTLRRG